MPSILVVDDSAAMRQMVSFTLKHSGFEVVGAVDGEDALTHARTRKFDLVVTDQNMPRLDGLGLIRSLRTMPQYKVVPIMILSTEFGEQIKQMGREAGSNAWLVKPFAPTRLLDAVSKLLETSLPVVA